MAPASPDLAAPPPVVLSIEALDTVVAQPFLTSPATPSSTTAAVVIDRQAVPAVLQGLNVKAVDTGQASVTQAALSVSLVLTQPSAVRLAR